MTPYGGILSLLAALSVPANAQEPAAACPAGLISVIFVDNHSVFDTDEFGDERRLRWAYDLANILHVRTKEAFIRAELLVREGDCYDALRLAESGRLLREYSFISRADVFGLRQSDGSWHVVVDTTDEWTIEANVRVNFEEGVEFRGADLTEENLFGRGVTLGGFLRSRDDQRDIGGSVGTPRLLGTRLDGFISAGTTRVGGFFRDQILYPFVGEIGRYAGRQLYSRREDRFTYWTSSGTAVLLPVDREVFDVTLAGRLGEPGLTILGLGLSRESLSFPGYPNSVELATSGDFGETEPADPETAALLASQTRFADVTRLNLLVGRRNIRFTRRGGLDALSGVEDVAVGLDVGLTVGFAVGGSSPEGEGVDDLYTRLQLFGGGEAGPLFVNLKGRIEGRQILGNSAEGDGWRDVIAEVDGLLYIQPDSWARHTFFARASGSGGWHLGLPFQLTLGGPEGVRGYREERFPGAHRLVFTLEDRILISWPAPNLFDFGFTLLADVGRTWAGDVPFGVDSGWRGAVGAGLRIGFPAGTRGIIRIDLAAPVDGARAWSPLLRISLLDLLGLTRILHDRQVERSRLSSIGPDFFTNPSPIF